MAIDIAIGQNSESTSLQSASGIDSVNRLENFETVQLQKRLINAVVHSSTFNRGTIDKMFHEALVANDGNLTKATTLFLENIGTRALALPVLNDPKNSFSQEQKVAIVMNAIRQEVMYTNHIRDLGSESEGGAPYSLARLLKTAGQVELLKELPKALMGLEHKYPQDPFLSDKEKNSEQGLVQLRQRYSELFHKGVVTGLVEDEDSLREVKTTFTKDPRREIEDIVKERLNLGKRAHISTEQIKPEDIKTWMVKKAEEFAQFIDTHPMYKPSLSHYVSGNPPTIDANKFNQDITDAIIASVRDSVYRTKGLAFIISQPDLVNAITENVKPKIKETFPFS